MLYKIYNKVINLLLKQNTFYSKKSYIYRILSSTGASNLCWTAFAAVLVQSIIKSPRVGSSLKLCSICLPIFKCFSV